MSKETVLLTRGLQQGFGGGTTRESTDRSGIPFETSSYEDSGDIYNDQWTGEIIGGGQEVVRIKRQ